MRGPGMGLSVKCNPAARRSGTGTPTPTPTPAPSLSLSSAVTQAEGDSGTSSFVWTLTLNRDGSTASYPYAWAVTGTGGSPANAADFGGTFPSGSGTFATGETSKTITVLVTGDTAVEPAETFLLTVTATGLTTVTSTGTISNDDASAQVVTLVAMSSQSNQSGRTAPDTIDPLNVTNVYQFGGSDQHVDTYRTISSSVRYLNHPDNIDGGAGGGVRVSQGPSFLAGLHSQNLGTIYIAVPVANGAPLTTTASGSSWASSPTGGAGGDRFEYMMTQLQLAKAAAVSAYPGATINVMLNHVGFEADAQISATRATLRTAFLAFIDDFRTRSAALGFANGATAPVIVGSMLPELWIIGSPNYNIGGTYAAVNAAQVDASLQRSNVFYAMGPDVRGGNDVLHYQPATVTRQQGAANAAIFADTTQPTVTTAAIYGSTNGRKLNFPLSGSMNHQTFEIHGGADAALFEISDPYISPVLRWVGDGTGPTTNAAYVVNVRARSGSGTYGPDKTITVTVYAVGQVPFSSYFSQGERGKAWDATDLTSLYQDNTGATAATGVALQRIGRMLDKSGRGEHFNASANDNTRPAYAIDGASKGMLNFTASQSRALYSTGAVTTDANPAITAVFGLSAAAQGQTANILVVNPTAGGLGAITPMRSNGTNPGIELYARNTASALLVTLPVLNSVLDGTKRVITSKMNGGNQNASIRNAASRSAGGGNGGYTTLLQASWNSTTAADRTVMMPSFDGSAYAGLIIGRIMTDDEIANVEDRVAYLMGLSALP